MSASGEPTAPGDATLLRLGLFYACLFAVLGVSLPFLPLWLEGRGLDPLEISSVVSIGIWMRVVAGPAWGAFADRGDRHRATMRALSALSLVFALLLYPRVGFVGLLFLMALVSATYPPLIPLHDSLSIGWCRARGADYGRLRLWGSIAFLATSAAAGAFLAGRSREWVLALLLSFHALTALGSLLLPRRVPARARTDAPRARLLALRGFAPLLLAVALVQGSHGAYYAFASIHWEAAGLSRGTIGLLWSEGVVAEVCLFAVAGRLLPWRPSALLLLGAGAGVVRWCVLAGTTAVPGLVAVQGLHALTFGATHLATVRWIAREVPDERSASAQALAAAVAAGLGPGLATPLAGALFERASPAAAFLAMAALAGCGGLAALGLARASR